MDSIFVTGYVKTKHNRLGDQLPPSIMAGQTTTEQKHSGPYLICVTGADTAKINPFFKSITGIKTGLTMTSLI